MRYWAGAARSLVRHLRDRDFARDWMAAGLRADTEPCAPTRWISDVYPEVSGMAVEMGTVTYRPGNVTPFEMFCLRAIAQRTKPVRIFEFGTFDGATTLALAQAAPGAEVHTLDLPSVDAAPGMADPVALETENRRVGGVGSRFVSTPEATRITQHLADSRAFDYAPLYGSVDLIFIDASHEEVFVRSDTSQALRMVAPGGVVLWHDYTEGWPGVRKVIDELSVTESVVRLELTSLALLQVGTNGPAPGSRGHRPGWSSAVA